MYKNQKSPSMSVRPIVIAIIAGSFIIGISISVGLAVGLKEDNVEISVTPVPTLPPGPYKSATGNYRYAAVVTDSEICSKIGTKVLAQHNGNAVDAAVASLFCIGVMTAHSTGLGGGAFWTIRINGTFYSMNARERAPLGADPYMFYGPENKLKSRVGGLAIGVPGELKGLYEVHKRFGTVAWSSLVMPTVKLCEDGHPLSPSTYKALRSANKTLIPEYYDEEGNKLPTGTTIRLPRLASTLRTIATDPMSYYTGQLAQDIVDDIAEKDGIITLQDLADYHVTWDTPTMMPMPNGLELYSTPPPGSGLVLGYIMGILSGYNMTSDAMAGLDAQTLTYHRVIEAFKFAYAKRSGLGDAEFYDNMELLANMTSSDYCEYTRKKITDDQAHPPKYYDPVWDITEDNGTTHLSIVDAMGNAVGVTSTINLYFGSKVQGSRTGIIFNDEMDDFSTPNTTNYFGVPSSPSNYIQPGKRPMSSMSPAIVWDAHAQKVRMVIGAAGGTKITTGVALSLMDVLWWGCSLPESIDRPRVHHQLIPTYYQAEKEFNPVIVAGLESKGQVHSVMTGWTVVNAIHVTDDGEIVGAADFRKGGVPDGY